MPSTRGTKRSKKSRPVRRKPAGKRSTGLRCPDCDFVAKHPMGLGRHRSTRHGVTSQRQQRRQESGGWVTRREAARRAGVHYNTIRHWEKTGRLRRGKGGGRGALVSASDLESLRRGGVAPDASAAIDGARIEALERRFNELLDGLEGLVAAARVRPRRGRPPRSRNAKRGR